MKRPSTLLLAPAIVLALAAAVVVGFKVLPGDDRAASGMSPDPAHPDLPRASASSRDRRETPRTAAELAGPWIELARRLEEEHAAAADPNAAFHVTLVPSKERSAAFDSFLAGLSADNAAEVYRMLTAEGAPSLLDAEWSRLLEKWGRLDGRTAFDTLAAGDVHHDRIPDLLRGWAGVNPQAAAAALGAHKESPEPWLGQAWHECVLSWQGGDLQAMERAITESCGKGAKDAATAALARRTVEVDPAAALDRSLAITDEAWRAIAFENVGRRWMEVNPSAAKAALEKAGTSPETVEALKLPPEPGFDMLQRPDLLSGDKAALEAAGVSVK